MTEPEKIKALFEALVGSAIQSFPARREKLKAPFEHGVYAIYSVKGKVLYVGRTTRGIVGLYQRLTNHLHGKSSLKKYFDGDSSKLREGCSFRCVVVKDDRRRALLEFYTIGCLCPAHFGLSDKANFQPFGFAKERFGSKSN